MRWFLMTVLASGVFCGTAGLARSEPTAEVRAILDRAIQAAGGKEKLAGIKAISVQGTATYYGELFPMRCGVSGAVQFPAQERLSLDFGIDGLRTVYTEILNGKQGWNNSRGRTSPLSADRLAAMQADAYLDWLTTLVPLRNRAFRVTALGEIQVNGRAAQTIEIRREGRPDVKLYFDRENGFLVWADVRLNPNLVQDYFYSDYKSFQGIQLATHQIIQRNGKNFLDMSFSDVAINPALDAGTFGKP